MWDNDPEPVTTKKDVTIFYDKTILPRRYIGSRAIRPDIAIWNK